MKTFMPRIERDRQKWWVVDLDGVVMGRAAVKVATILRGKNKPTFTPHLDTGDCIIAINAGAMRVTGAHKPQQLAYYHYSGYPGGLKKVTFAEQMQKKPEQAFSMAVRRMLPKNRLGRKLFKKLHVYAGPEHPHRAQRPEKLESLI